MEIFNHPMIPYVLSLIGGGVATKFLIEARKFTLVLRGKNGGAAQSPQVQGVPVEVVEILSGINTNLTALNKNAESRSTVGIKSLEVATKALKQTNSVSRRLTETYGILKTAVDNQKRFYTTMLKSKRGR